MSDETTSEQEEPNIESIKAMLEKQVTTNVAIETDLIRQKIRPNPNIIATLRLDLLLNLLLDEPTRYAYELESAKQVHAMLMQIQQEVHAKATEPKLLLPDPGMMPPKNLHL